MNRTNMKRCFIWPGAVLLTPSVTRLRDSLLRKLNSLPDSSKTWEVPSTKVERSPFPGKDPASRRLVSNQWIVEISPGKSMENAVGCVSSGSTHKSGLACLSCHKNGEPNLDSFAKLKSITPASFQRNVSPCAVFALPYLNLCRARRFQRSTAQSSAPQIPATRKFQFPI